MSNVDSVFGEAPTRDQPLEGLVVELAEIEALEADKEKTVKGYNDKIKAREARIREIRQGSKDEADPQLTLHRQEG